MVQPFDSSADVPDGFTEQVVEVNGIALHYLRGGAGRPVVLLHGWPQTWYEWRLVMPKLAERYDLIVPSLRGLHVAEPPPAAAGYDARTMATDIRALVQSLGFGFVDVVGHDIGMLVAYAFGATYPAETRRLVIMEGVLVGIEPMSTEFARNPLSWNFGFNMTPALPERLCEGRERILFDFFFDTISMHPEKITKDAREEYARVYSQPGAMTAGFEWYRAFPQDIDLNLAGTQNRLKMPVLGLGSEKTMGRFMRPMLQQVADDVRAYTFADCGHYIPEEKPNELVEQLIAFFEAK